MTYNIETLNFITFFKITQTDNKYLLLKYHSRFTWLNKLIIWLFRIDLDSVWDDIMKQYNQGQENLRVKKIKSLKEDYDRLNSKYQSIIVILEVLKYGADEEMQTLLKEHGYEIKGEHRKGLENVYKQVENFKNKIEAIGSELETYLDVKSEEKTNGYEVLIGVLFNLEALSIPPSNVKVIEFINYKKVLDRKIKAQKKK